MECNEIRELLSLYIDQMLDDHEQKEIEKHLSACEACNQEYQDLNEIHLLLSGMDPVPVPEAFELRLKQALQEEKKRTSGYGGPIKSLFGSKRYRMLASAAAVFAVGVLTLGVYQDVLGDFADKLGFIDRDGIEHAAPRDAEADLYGISNDEAGSDDSMNNQPNQLEDQPVQDQAQRNKNSEVQEMKLYQAQIDSDGAASSGQKNAPLKKEAAGLTAPEVASDNGAAADGAPSSTTENSDSNGAAGSAPAGGSDTAGLENIKEKELSFGSLAQDEVRAKSKADQSGNSCSRSLTSSGVERNTAAVHFYMGLIEERLEGFDYQVLESGYAPTGEWNFKIFIFRGKDGNTYNEEIRVIGKDGKIKIICSNEITEL
ncbi:MAG: hypothetical protein K0Q48_730 [Bacillota bacterium]|jgi:hypothetical protein|nr:hypothetical protein [Bacillota bacterium]